MKHSRDVRNQSDVDTGNVVAQLDVRDLVQEICKNNVVFLQTYDHFDFLSLGGGGSKAGNNELIV